MKNDLNPDKQSYWLAFLKVADVGFKVTATSFAVSFVVTPLQLLVSNLQDSRKLSGYAFMQSLAKAYPSSVTGGQIRGMNSVTSKTLGSKKMLEVEETLTGKSDLDIKDIEIMGAAKAIETDGVEIKAPARTTVRRFYHEPLVQAGVFAQIDTIAPAYWQNKAKLRGLDRAVGPFTGTNFLQYSLMGYGFKSISCGVSFASLLIFSDKISALMPFEDKTTAGFVGGALTGAMTACVTYPINEAHDRVVMASKVDRAGKVSAPSSFGFFKANVLQPIKLDGFSSSAMKFWMSTRVVLPPRILSSICIFSIIQGLNTYLSPTAVSDRFSDSLRSDFRKG